MDFRAEPRGKGILEMTFLKALNKNFQFSFFFVNFQKSFQIFQNIFKNT